MVWLRSPGDAKINPYPNGSGFVPAHSLRSTNIPADVFDDSIGCGVEISSQLIYIKMPFISFGGRQTVEVWKPMSHISDTFTGIAFVILAVPESNDAKPLNRPSQSGRVLVCNHVLHHGLQYESETCWLGDNR
jgi:hypothetical protein